MPTGTLLSPGCDTCFNCEDPPPPGCDCDVFAIFEPGKLSARLNMPTETICTGKTTADSSGTPRCYPMCTANWGLGTGISRLQPPYTFPFVGGANDGGLESQCFAYTGIFSYGFGFGYSAFIDSLTRVWQIRNVSWAIGPQRLVPDPLNSNLLKLEPTSTHWLRLYESWGLPGEFSNSYIVHQVDTELCDECFSGTLTFPKAQWNSAYNWLDRSGGVPPVCSNWTSMELISTRDCTANCAANCCDGLKAGSPNITTANKWTVGVAGGSACFPFAIPWTTTLAESPTCTFQSTYAVGGGSCFTDSGGGNWFVLQIKLIVTSTNVAGPKPCTEAQVRIVYERVSDGMLAEQIYNFGYDYCTYTSGSLSLSGTSHTFPLNAPTFPSVTLTANP